MYAYVDTIVSRRNASNYSLPVRSFLLEDRCRFLSNFSLATADVEIPGEYLVPKVFLWARIRRNYFQLIFNFNPSLPPAHALLCPHCSIHATSGDSSKAELDCQKALYSGTQRKGIRQPIATCTCKCFLVIVVHMTLCVLNMIVCRSTPTWS